MTRRLRRLSRALRPRSADRGAADLDAHAATRYSNLVARAETTLEERDLESARASIEAVLDAGGGWTGTDLELIARYATMVDDRQAGQPLAEPEQRGPIPSGETIIEPSTSTFDPYVVVGDPSASLQGLRDGLEAVRPGISVRRIKDAGVLHVRGRTLLTDADGVTIADGDSVGSRPLAGLAEAAFRGRPVKRIDGRALLVADGTDGDLYGHWLLDQFTRLALYQRAGVASGTLLVDGSRSGFKTETLATVRDLHDDIEDMRSVPALRVAELHVASNMGADLRHPAHKAAPWALDFLRERLMPEDRSSTGSTRLYVSRSDLPRRHVIDEGRLTGELRRRGFAIVNLGAMDVADQTRAFFAADVIIAPHGDGLANLVFCRPGTRVLELFPATYGTVSYALLAAARDLDYTAMVGTAAEPLVGAPITHDVGVDVAAVTDWLEHPPRRPRPDTVRAETERRKRSLDIGVDAALAAGDLEAALGGTRALLSTADWGRHEREASMRYIRAANANDGTRWSLPATRPDPLARSERIVDASEALVPAIDLQGVTPDVLAPTSFGRRQLRPPIDVWTIPDATVVYVQGVLLVRDASGKPVAQCSGRGSASLEQLADTLIEHKPAAAIDGRALVLLDWTNGGNYCLWVNNHLTRLALYERAGLTPAPVLVHTMDKPFHRRSLSAFTDLIETVVPMDETPVAHVAELIVADNIGERFRHPAHKSAPWATRFIRERLGPDDRPEPTELLYISRADAARRRVVNEDGLMAELGPRGFRQVTMSGLDVFEQAAMFARARAVIGAHGAGLTNLLFSQPGTKVLELFSQHDGTSAYALTSALNGLGYTSLGSAALSPSQAPTGYGPETGDILVDIASVAAWCDRLA